MRIAATALIIGLLAAGTAVAPARAEVTTCVFGGPAPGHRAVRLDLPEGSDAFVLRLTGERGPRLVNDGDDSEWHLAQGVLVVDVDTFELAGYQVDYVGTGPPRVALTTDGQAARQGVPAPEGPFRHGARFAPPTLDPGSYYVVGFGTTGTDGGPQWWGGSVTVSPEVSCLPVGEGETFDLDQTRFEGGEQVHVPGAGVAEGIAASFSTDRTLVVGLIDAAVQGGVGSVEVDYEMPTASGTMGRGIAPFVSTGGTYRFEARYAGAYPLVAVAGAEVTLP